MTCTTCHSPHAGDPEDFLLVSDLYTLCTSCHRNTELVEPLHHPVVEMFEGQTVVEGIEGIQSAHFSAEEGPRCITCHMTGVPVGSATLASHTWQPVIPGETADGPPDACSGCHTDLNTADLESLVLDTQASVERRLSLASTRLGSIPPPEPGTDAAASYDRAAAALAFVQGDGSLGVHNYAYADALLDTVQNELAVLSVPGATLAADGRPAPDRDTVCAAADHCRRGASGAHRTAPDDDHPAGGCHRLPDRVGRGNLVASPARSPHRGVCTMKGLAKLSLLLAGVLFWLAAAATGLTWAQDSDVEATPAPEPAVSAESAAEATPEPASDEYCLLCHTEPDQVWTLPSGETLSVTIDPSILAHSVHGDSAEGGTLACADCHGDFRYPHPVSNARSIREFQIERYASCRSCHEEQYTRAQDSVHGALLREGRLDAATCVDCHGGHDIQSPNDPPQRISLTCGSCHGVIFEDYRTSVHGAALLDENNPDVPTCITCHGVHDIHDPTAGEFRSRVAATVRDLPRGQRTDGKVRHQHRGLRQLRVRVPRLDDGAVRA